MTQDYRRLEQRALKAAADRMAREIEGEIFESGPTTRRLERPNPEFQELPVLDETANIKPEQWERLKAIAKAHPFQTLQSAFIKRGGLKADEFFLIAPPRQSQGKSNLVAHFLKLREEHLAEQRRIARFGIQTAVAAFIASFKR